MFLLLFSEVLAVIGLIVLLFDHEFWAVLPLLAGIFLIKWCFRFVCSAEAYVQPNGLWKACVNSFLGFEAKLSTEAWLDLCQRHPSPSDAAAYVRILMQLPGSEK